MKAILTIAILTLFLSSCKHSSSTASKGEQGDKIILVQICNDDTDNEYHRRMLNVDTKECPHLKSCGDDTQTISVEVAQKDGRTPCTYCFR